MYELNGIKDKTASLQKNAEPCHDKNADESLNCANAHDPYLPCLDRSLAISLKPKADGEEPLFR